MVEGITIGQLSIQKKKNEVLKLGVAFDEQEIMKIPKEKYDKKLDIIVTPTRLII